MDPDQDSQRIAGKPEGVPHMRHTPVLKQEPENVRAEMTNQDDLPSAATYDSPKRQCLREGGQDINPNTPSTSGIQSHIKDLPRILTGETEDKSLKRKAPTPAKDFAGTSSSRCTSEDDLTHHVIQKEKKPRFQPSQSVPVSSPKKTQAPDDSGVVAASTSSSLTRNSPLKSSKMNFEDSFDDTDEIPKSAARQQAELAEDEEEGVPEIVSSSDEDSDEDFGPDGQISKDLAECLFGGLELSEFNENIGQINIHPLSKQPTIAWNILKTTQVVENLTPLDSSTPISEDKIRFVCISDTHSKVEGLANFVPPGDVLLHTGDFTQFGFPEAIKKFDDFLGLLPHKAKIVIAGNHDLTLDEDMVKNHREEMTLRYKLERDVFEDYLTALNVPSARQLLKNCHYLFNSHIQVCGINIYGAPWQPKFRGMAFNLSRGLDCLKMWNNIPEDTNILMTHGPPIGHGDLCKNLQRAGCVELLNSVQNRLHLRYHLFGHIHEGYGVTTDGQTIFINSSSCNLHHKLKNKPIVFDYPIPEGHSKEELNYFPVNNLE